MALVPDKANWSEELSNSINLSEIPVIETHWIGLEFMIRSALFYKHKDGRYIVELHLTPYPNISCDFPDSCRNKEEIRRTWDQFLQTIVDVDTNIKGTSNKVGEANNINNILSKIYRWIGQKILSV